MLGFIQKEIEKGRQAYIVYPLINESVDLYNKLFIKEKIESLFDENTPNLFRDFLYTCILIHLSGFYQVYKPSMTLIKNQEEEESEEMVGGNPNIESPQ